MRARTVIAGVALAATLAIAYAAGASVFPRAETDKAAVISNDPDVRSTEASSLYEKAVSSEKSVRVIPITANGIPSDGTPWYNRTWQTQIPSNTALSRPTNPSVTPISPRLRKQAKQTRSRDVTAHRERGPAQNGFNPRSANAFGSRDQGIFLFSW